MKLAVNLSLHKTPDIKQTLEPKEQRINLVQAPRELGLQLAARSRLPSPHHRHFPSKAHCLDVILAATRRGPGERTGAPRLAPHRVQAQIDLCLASVSCTATAPLPLSEFPSKRKHSTTTPYQQTNCAARIKLILQHAPTKHREVTNRKKAVCSAGCPGSKSPNMHGAMWTARPV